MKKQLNPQRIKVARERRKLSKKQLADLIGVSSRTITQYESEQIEIQRNSGVIERISKCLNYPITFFEGDDLVELNEKAVSFRAATKMTAKDKNAALRAGEIALLFNDWIEKKFSLPTLELPDLTTPFFDKKPEIAAEQLRYYWGLGERSIKNMTHLLESKGFRVYSLVENCLDVDAYTFWHEKTPFIFLNTQKTPERSRFDAAHELGHIILHYNEENMDHKEMEAEANRFASAFLMPERTVTAIVPYQPSLNTLIKLKKHWNVSLAALVKRVYELELSTEWGYRQHYIQLGQLGYRKGEPEGIKERETSLIIEKVVELLRKKKYTQQNVENETSLPAEEIANLAFKHPFFNLRLV